MLRSCPRLVGLRASDPTVSRLVATRAGNIENALSAIADAGAMAGNGSRMGRDAFELVDAVPERTRAIERYGSSPRAGIFMLALGPARLGYAMVRHHRGVGLIAKRSPKAKVVCAIWH
jgi:hypothetical protein